MNKHLYLLLLTFLSLVLISANPAGMYINKDYGELKANPRGFKLIHEDTDGNFRYSTYRKYYLILYFADVDPKTNKRPLISVEIREINSQKMAQDYLLREIMRKESNRGP